MQDNTQNLAPPSAPSQVAVCVPLWYTSNQVLQKFLLNVISIVTRPGILQNLWTPSLAANFVRDLVDMRVCGPFVRVCAARVLGRESISGGQYSGEFVAKTNACLSS